MDPYQKKQDELFASIHSGRPTNNGRYMALSKMTGIPGQIATFTGQKISLDQAIAAGNIFGPAECSFSMEPPIKPDANGLYAAAIPGVTKLL